MNYELAKQLKDAGFPQGEPYNNYLYCDEHEDLEHTEECSAYIPTLEELIEACGDDFGEVGLAGHCEDRGKWRASQGWDGCGGYDNDVYADTPTEAVANLWLSLNKKLK